MVEMARVLVVDDDVSIADLLRTVFEDAGHETIVAPDLDEVQPRVRPDCVVADLVALKGYTTAGAREWVDRLHGRFPGRPLILLTAHAEAERDREALEVTDVVTKPFDIDRLLSAVDAALATS